MYSIWFNVLCSSQFGEKPSLIVLKLYGILVLGFNFASGVVFKLSPFL